MKRGLMLVVIATLALPVVALAALIGQQEYRIANAQTLNVPVRGVDPRDLLQGHYLLATFDWNWQSEPAFSGAGGLCVLSDGDGAKPQVRFVAGWQPSNDAPAGCRLMIAGSARSRRNSLTAAFAPTGLDAGNFTVHLFVAERHARALEDLIRQRPGALSVDLAVRTDGIATVRHLRLDGQILDR